MSDTYTKLFSSITESTIVSEPVATRWLWVTMLAMADAGGCVYGSVPGIARRANITLQETEAALATFYAPDPYSRTKDHEGRRIVDIDGGWRLLNHAKYAAIRSEAERRDYKRQWDRDNRPSGHLREAVRQQSDKSDESPNCPTFPTPLDLDLSKKQEQEQQRDSATGEPAAKPGRKDGRRGTRLPDGWQPSEAVRVWARSEHPAVNLGFVLAEFVDYWLAIPGSRGCKLDWDATFRNRVREVAARQPRTSHATHRESVADRAARLAREGDERDRLAGIT